MTKLDGVTTKHVDLKCYMVEKIAEAEINAKEAEVQTKKYAKAMKLSRFTYRSNEGQSKKISWKECKEKYAMSNSMIPSLTSSLRSDENIVLSDIDFDEGSWHPLDANTPSKAGDFARAIHFLRADSNR